MKDRAGWGWLAVLSSISNVIRCLGLAAFVLFSGWVSVVAESVRKALRGYIRGEQRLTAIFEHATAGMFEVMAGDLRIRNVNPALCSLTGFSSG